MKPATLLTAGAALACGGAAVAREPGAVYFRCSVSHAFTLPGARGGEVQIRSGRNSPYQMSREALSAESIYATAEVEGDGALTNLGLSWIQNGTYWDQQDRLRLDLHPVYIAINFGSAIPWGRRDARHFEADRMEVVINIVAGQKLRHGALVALYRQDAHGMAMTLGGPAESYDFRHVRATVRVLWRDLAAVADGQTAMDLHLMEPSRRINYPGAEIARGSLDLSIMPALIDQFRAAEADLRAMAAQAAGRCERAIEPEPEPEI
jgi:hypothetical protein